MTEDPPVGPDEPPVCDVDSCDGEPVWLLGDRLRSRRLSVCFDCRDELGSRRRYRLIGPDEPPAPDER